VSTLYWQEALFGIASLPLPTKLIGQAYRMDSLIGNVPASTYGTITGCSIEDCPPRMRVSMSGPVAGLLFSKQENTWRWEVEGREDIRVVSFGVQGKDDRLVGNSSDYQAMFRRYIELVSKEGTARSTDWQETQLLGEKLQLSDTFRELTREYGYSIRDTAYRNLLFHVFNRDRVITFDYNDIVELYRKKIFPYPHSQIQALEQLAVIKEMRISFGNRCAVWAARTVAKLASPFKEVSMILGGSATAQEQLRQKLQVPHHQLSNLVIRTGTQLRDSFLLFLQKEYSASFCVRRNKLFDRKNVSRVLLKTTDSLVRSLSSIPGVEKINPECIALVLNREEVRRVKKTIVRIIRISHLCIEMKVSYHIFDQEVAISVSDYFTLNKLLKYLEG
jgi:hypothetical protein